MWLVGVALALKHIIGTNLIPYVYAVIFVVLHFHDIEIVMLFHNIQGVKSLYCVHASCGDRTHQVCNWLTMYVKNIDCTNGGEMLLFERNIRPTLSISCGYLYNWPHASNNVHVIVATILPSRCTGFSYVCTLLSHQ